MENIYNILQYRKNIVAETIVKSFIDEDIEKAQYVHRNHKYDHIEETKTGRKKYVYLDRSNFRRIIGRKKKLNSLEEITRKSKMLIPNSHKLRNEIIDKLSSVEGVVFTQPRGRIDKSKSTDSVYIHIKKDDVKFKLRMSNHTKSTYHNQAIFPVEYNLHDREWEIDVCLGRYGSNDVVNLVKNICNNVSLYNNNETKEKIRKIAIENGIEPTKNEVIKDLPYKLAEKYIDENGIEDDKYGTVFQTLKYVSALVYGKKHFVRNKYIIKS